MSSIKRREFITLLGGAAAWPLAARAQQAAKVPTIGFLGSGTPITAGAWVVAFAQRLRELGWIEDRTIKIDLRWAEEHTSELQSLRHLVCRLLLEKKKKKKIEK